MTAVDGLHQRIYVVHFERIGRSHSVPDLAVNASDADGIAEAVHRYARKFLASREYEVSISLEETEMRGSIVCGFRPGGDFRIEDRGEFIQ